MRLIFVYKANSGKLNTLLDIGHKLFSPSTYSCRLCTLTFDVFTENSIWKTFRKDSNLNMDFYHKDEFEVVFPNVKMTYPTVLKLQKDQLTIVLTNEVLSKISDTEGLIKLLKLQLKID